MSFTPVKTLCLLFFLAWQCSFAQIIPASFRKTVDSLIQASPKTYKELDAALRANRRDSTLMKYFLLEAAKFKYWDGQSYAYNQLGTKYRNISEFYRAIELHQNGLKAAVKGRNIEFRIFSLNMLAVAYRRLDAIKTALDFSQEALELADNIENPSEGIKRSINVSHNSIGNIYLTLKQYDLAVEQFRISLKLEEEMGNLLGMAINHQNIGECMEAQGRLEDALKSYRLSLEYNEENDSDRGIAICKNSISQVYIKQNKLQEALQILEPTLLSAEATGDKHIITGVLINLGWVLTKLNRYEEAARFLKEGLKTASNHNLPFSVTKSYLLLAELSSEKGEYQNALDYYKKAKEIEESISNQVNFNYVNDVIIRYDSQKKSNQIEVLAKQNEIVGLKLRRNQNILLVSALLLALFTLILYILYRQYQLKSDKKMLTLEQSMLRSQMNPHFLFNSLNSIKLYIINNEQKNAVHYLNKFSKLVRKILEASSLKEIPLAEELETVELYMNIENIRFSDEINFNINVCEEVDTHLIKIPSLILQPFLENALWHGLSSKEGEKYIELKVTREKSGFIHIAITDNGIGRAMSEKLKESKLLKRKSVGIDITKERLANFSRDYQNSFNVEINDLFDNEGNSTGTRVVLHIPTI